MMALQKIQSTSTSDKIRNTIFLNLDRSTCLSQKLETSILGRHENFSIRLSVRQNSQLILANIHVFCLFVDLFFSRNHIILISSNLILQIFHVFVSLGFTLSSSFSKV